MNKILVIAAHPDDEVLGCGGMIARMDDVHVLFLGRGRNGEEENNIVRQEKVADLLQFDFGFRSYPDNQFDTVPLIDIVETIEYKIEYHKPDTIFTHFRNDLNIDHRITYQATITATRPKGGVKEIYSYEVPTSTNWGFPISFSPDFFIKMKPDELGRKMTALNIYESELNPHRNGETIRFFAHYRGMMAGCEYAEAFETIRRVI